jgi:hypothetical protein
MLAIISPTSGGRSVGIVRSRTRAIEFSFFEFFIHSFKISIIADILKVRLFFFKESKKKHDTSFLTHAISS